MNHKNHCVCACMRACVRALCCIARNFQWKQSSEIFENESFSRITADSIILENIILEIFTLNLWVYSFLMANKIYTTD